MNYLKGTAFLDSNLNYDSFASGCNLYLRNRLHNINVKPILIKFMQKLYAQKRGIWWLTHHLVHCWKLTQVKWRRQKKAYDYGDKNIIRSHFRPERWLFPFYVDHFAITQKTAKCPRIICIDKTSLLEFLCSMFFVFFLQDSWNFFLL